MRPPIHPNRSIAGSTGAWVLIFCTTVLAAVYFTVSQPVLTRLFGIPVQLTGLQRPVPASTATLPPNPESVPIPARTPRPTKPLISKAAPTSTPAPFPTPSATPVAQAPVAQSSATPKATPSAPPSAKPPPFPAPAKESPLDLETLSQTPSMWPKQVGLIKTTPFPILMGGSEVGTVQVPPGMNLRLTQVVGRQVEVEYQSNRRLIPADSTDVLARATALARLKPSALPSPTPTPSPTPEAAAPPPLPTAPPALSAKVRLDDRVAIDVVRAWKTGSLAANSKDEVALRIRISNSDPRMAIDSMKGEIYAFAVNASAHTQYKLLGSQTFDFSIPARGRYEFTTDTTPASPNKAAAGTQATTTDSHVPRFRYEGWLLRILDDTGQVALQKASSSHLLKLADKASTLTVGEPFDRTTLQPPAER